ncbi:MAG: biopolymer transporter ExbD [Verrucomicrobia bacterium]|nr:MAG: biopolymer transporter ExbD [Verrucomicrobiota bacterium]
MSLITRRRKRPEINIVPLMDVLTILIFFFLVSMQFRERLTLNLTLPKIETAGRNEFESPVIIGIDRDGNFFFNGDAATGEQLESLVRIVAEQSVDIMVLIKAHEDTPLQKVTFAMDACRKAGLNRIRLQSR